MSQSKIILVAGPTASGKSALAMELARTGQGTIINTDAMQVYEGLPILSAQPDAKNRKAVPHELYGTLDPAERSSAGRWAEMAAAAIEKTVAQKRVPILAGGTGLYFRALMGGLAPIPAIPENVREKAEALYKEIGEEKFRAKLAKLDPDSAKKLARNDRQRLIRAYEVALHTGKPLGHWHQKSAPGFLDGYKIEAHLLMPEREKLYAACDRRFDKMLEAGAIEEVKSFLKRKLDPDLPAMKTLGLREIAAYLKGEMKLDEAIVKAQQATRNYAKRQMTWFRNQWKFL